MLNSKHIVVLLLLILSVCLLTQKLNGQDIDSEFRTAVDLYSSGDFDQSLPIFSKIIDEYDSNSKTTASIIFKAKIFLNGQKYSDAKKVLTSFIERYPTSRYVDEARMMLVKINFEEANYFAALKEVGYLADNSFSSEDITEAKELGGRIAYNYLSSIQVQGLVDSFSGAKTKPYFMLLLGKSYLKANDEFNGKKELEDLMSRFPDSEEFSEAKDIYDSPVVITETSSPAIIIGVMLPLQADESGNYTSTASVEILEGIKFAISEFNSTHDEKIGIAIRDTKSDNETITEIKNEFEDNSSVKVILGPLHSNEVRATLEEFEDSGIPVVSPTATDDDLTGVSEYFFQANPSFFQRGKTIAQYIYYVEDKRKISILNSIDDYSPLLASTFEEEFTKLGGEILKHETFKSKSFDLVSPISRIAEDSLIIEGIYIPLSDNLDAPGILSELVKNNLNVSIYGNQDWFSAKGFETSPELSNKITFDSDYFIDFTSEEYIKFNTSFSEITGKDANRNVLYGYDTAGYLLTVMRNIVPSRSSLISKMISGITSVGLRNNICFDESRVNKYLNIVRYKDGVFELVEKFKSAE